MDRLARYLDLPGESGFDAVLQWMLHLRETLGMPHTLEAAQGFDEAMAKRLAPLAVADPSMGTNPKPADEAACEQVFLKALRGDLT
jgi:alcohol dehydrogenase class IV